MESEAEAKQISITRLPIFRKPHSYVGVQSPERLEMQSPTHYSSASVPFRWEEEPGKPRGGTTALSSPVGLSLRTLEPPPRLLTDACVPSPTTVFDGPYVGRRKFQSSSFRMVGKELYGSFRWSFTPERRQQLGTVLQCKRRLKEGGLLGSWRWGRKALMKDKREVGGRSTYVFPASVDKESEYGHAEDKKSSERSKMMRTGSYSSLSRARPQLLGTIYEGLKQVVPWRSRKQKKDGLS